MIQKIEIFTFVLSSLYCLKHIIAFFVMLGQDDPAPIKIGTVDKILLYLSASFILTAIINAIFL